MDDSAVHVGQSKIPAGVTVGQTFMIKSQLMQNCGLQIVNADLIFGDAVSQIVAAAKDHATSDAGAGEPRTVNS